MMTQTTLNLVTRELVPEDRRMSITGKYFGLHWPLQIEPTVYGITERMAREYKGGYWDFYTLSNGGFYMAPSSDDTFSVICDNQFEGDALRTPVDEVIAGRRRQRLGRHQ